MIENFSYNPSIYNQLSGALDTIWSIQNFNNIWKMYKIQIIPGKSLRDQEEAKKAE